jgi:DNA recombination protein RmuC
VTEVIAGLVAGVLIGSGVAWFAARAHARVRLIGEVQARESRLAAAEATADELRKQLSQRELEAGDLHEALATARTQGAQAETRFDEARRNLEEQRALLEETRQKLHGAFAELSAKALRESKDDFLQLAEQKIGSQLHERQAAIDGLVKPLQESLRRYEEHVRALESARQQAYGNLEEQLRTLNVRSAELQRETGTLVTVLSRSSQARGRWGEITLRRVVELSGMTPRCDFREQVSVEGEAGRVRPDVVIHLPDRREIVIDAKVPLSAYFEAMAATGPEDRQAALARHAQQLRQHMTQLASKTYWAEFPQSCDFVVMFIPGESFFGGAIEVDGALIEDAMSRRIVIATPTTLIGLLLAIHHGWRQAQMAESAQKISDLGKDLYDRVRTMGRHFERMRKGLVQATEAYNDTVGSLERRVLPVARKFEEVGAASGDEIAPLEPIDQQPRAVTAQELMVQETLPEISPP